MTLTIGMIVKNEEKFLRSCLDSIKPLLDELDSELIIFDTGSTDATVEIAREFTEEVHTLEWRKDFAWARNHTLDMAKGEWYMWVDADEVYQDVSGIIEFFNSGEYKMYNAASVVWKNMHRGSAFSLFHPRKLHKCGDGMRWVGKIHECIVPVLMPCKALADVVALHYGYYYETAEDRKAKSARNIPPLLERFEEDPTDAKNILQLITDYAVAAQFEESKRFVRIGLDLLEDRKESEFYHIFIKHYSGYLFGSGKYEECIEFVQDYFKNTEIVHANAEFIKNDEVASLQMLKRYGESARAGIEVLKWISRSRHGRLSKHILSMQVINELSEKTVISGIIQNFALAGEFEYAIGWLNNYEELLDIKKSDIFNHFVSRAISENRHRDLVSLYEYARISLPPDSVDYHNAIDAIEVNMTNPYAKVQISKVFAGAYPVSDDDYIELLRLRSGDLGKDTLLRFLDGDKSYSQRFGDVIIAAIKQNADVSKFLRNLQITSTNDLAIWLLYTNLDTDSILLDYNPEGEELSLKLMHLLSTLYFVLQSTAPKEPRFIERRLVFFEKYVRMRRSYASALYRADVFCEDAAATLPEQDGFAFYAGKAYECKDNGDTEGFLKNMEQAVEILPAMKEITLHLTRGNDGECG